MTNTSKHTPGPWTAGSVHRVNADGGWKSFVITDSGKRSIACCTANTTRDGLEVKANARLIAAAHDLDEALSTLVQYAEWQITEGLNYHPTLRSAIGKARAALAKARVEA